MKYMQCLVLSILFIVAQMQEWTGEICYRFLPQSSNNRKVCIDRPTSKECTSSHDLTPVNRSVCCEGYSHDGDYNCSIPLCYTKCANGGTCIKPNVCNCPYPHQGDDCLSELCFHEIPCYPGTCSSNNNCECANGFSNPTEEADIVPLNNCLKIDNVEIQNLTILDFNVILINAPEQDDVASTNETVVEKQTIESNRDEEFTWTSLRRIAVIQLSGSSIYMPPDLTDTPVYVVGHRFGIISGVFTVNLKQNDEDNEIVDVHEDCNEDVSSTNPTSGIFVCTIIKDQDFHPEHGNTLEITFVTKGGGFRELQDLNTLNSKTQAYIPIMIEEAVVFKFDIEPPRPCDVENIEQCNASLMVPEKSVMENISVEWHGWVDDDSGILTYTLAVFSMTKNNNSELEVNVDALSDPVFGPIEVRNGNIDQLSFNVTNTGVYSMVLCVADYTSNQECVRRLVTYDANSSITSYPEHGISVASANKLGDTFYQNSPNVFISWEEHFANEQHEALGLLWAVEEFPGNISVDISMNNQSEVEFIDSIVVSDSMDDHEGERTVDAIPNVHSIVNFQVHYITEPSKISELPDIPQIFPHDLGTVTSFRYSISNMDHQTVRYFVKAIDFMGAEKVEQTRITFDFSKPIIHKFNLQNDDPMLEANSSSRIILDVDDLESGIFSIHVTFKENTGALVHEQKFDQSTTTDCESDNKFCHCLQPGLCFHTNHSLTFSNCMLIGQNIPPIEQGIAITATVTNLAGLTDEKTLLIADISSLNGILAYVPPGDFNATHDSFHSLSISWHLPPSCIEVEVILWLQINEEKFKLDMDNVQASSYTYNGILPGSSYDTSLIADYETGVEYQSNVVTINPGFLATFGFVIIVVVATTLLLLMIAVFSVWRILGRRKQSDDYDEEERISYDIAEDDLLEDDVLGNEGDLTLNELVTQGKFAVIYTATYIKNEMPLLVAAKLLKVEYKETGKEKMESKINFMKNELDKHSNIIMYLGSISHYANRGPVLLMEYCELGQLDKWLSSVSSEYTGQMLELLFRFSIEIANAMIFLSSSDIVHQRLAAQNVLLTNELQTKLYGFGPPKEDEELFEDQVLPAKWCAPEVLQGMESTTDSDVWSFGVVLWEIFSMGDVPFNETPSSEIAKKLTDGYQLPKPERADELLYGLITKCWKLKSVKRPTFEKIHDTLILLRQSDGSGGFSEAVMEMLEAMDEDCESIHEADENPPDGLTLGKQIDSGRFADIYLATYVTDGIATDLVAKVLKVGYSKSDVLKMESKMNFMRNELQEHKNIVNFIDSIFDYADRGPVLLMEYCEQGQLDKWLISMSSEYSEQMFGLLLGFSIEIANAMMFLSSEDIVHQQLAAHNVLLTNELQTKLCGFGPAREDVELFQDEVLPAKWCAPEVLQGVESSTDSDVWSFGVVLWEIFCMGDVPFSDTHSSEIVARLMDGYRLPKPEKAIELLYVLMNKCWQLKALKRPSFENIYNVLIFLGNSDNMEDITNTVLEMLTQDDEDSADDEEKPPDGLTLNEQIGSGRFADIYLATSVTDGIGTTIVAKVLKVGCAKKDIKKMNHKIDFFKETVGQHVNIITFMGMATVDGKPSPIMMLEYCEVGQLDRYLRHNVELLTNKMAAELYRFALEVSEALIYLKSKEILHKRIAARNILLTSDLVPKLSGFGPQGSERPDKIIPVKWCALEVLENEPPTQKSEIWSYGVVLWEIFSMGQLPYDFPPTEIAVRLKCGYRLSKPNKAVKPELYSLMKECWSENPEDRPSIQHIHNIVNKIYIDSLSSSSQVQA